ncbi:MAG: type III-A CRISPR-associated protein Cas10/Csm1 [Lachnospiraceae bacterium]|nr:type III-A CRISPR-associated protein Cas10/Csm1 [Lachnospiraceae bacterium]
MTDKQLRLVIGGLLHDTGKVLYRGDDHRNHSESGYEFIKNDTTMKDPEVLDQIRYHHAGQLKGANLKTDSLAYITYIADNIAAAMDRREKTEGGEKGFVRDMPLDSIFNILNNNHDSKVYRPMMLDANGEINYPTGKVTAYPESFYQEVKRQIKDCLNALEWRDEYINSLLSVLEATLTFVPSSTAKHELADISLYDHVKMTAAIGSCIYEYLQDKGETDYRQVLYKKAKEFYKEKAFLLYSMDISGIQKFIYTITSEGALKGLRSRSFYLEIMMEHLVDQLLREAALSRANLIYSGGGHAYILLPNTERMKQRIDAFEQDTNQWFLEQFKTALYIAGGYAECSAEALYDQPSGSYREIFRSISGMISERKLKRYTPKQILYLNKNSYPEGTRECKVCGRSDHLLDDRRCEICGALEEISRDVLKKEAFYTILNKKEKGALPLPGGCYLVTDSKEKLIRRIKEDDHYVRAYSKNELFTGYDIATNLWVGDYVKEDANTFEKLAEASPARDFKRLGVLRADVDNLGQAFVRGFEQKNKNSSYMTLSRTATFSRKLSIFFKNHINGLLQEGSYMLTDEDGRERNALIVYSGGDDVFLVGSWDDVIGFAIDLHDSLETYSQEALTISAGIGLYPAKYPISVMAQETEALEAASKALEGKDGITLFDPKYAFHWDELINEVLEEKLALIREYFGENNDKGNSFLYHMLELLRGIKDDRINLARYAYLLGRVAPQKKSNLTEEEEKEAETKAKVYERFSKQMYEWSKHERDVRQLEMAIYLYVYMNRGKEG